MGRRPACRPVSPPSAPGKIAALVDEIGWSERHFAREFRYHLGMTPKGFARMVDIALDCSYYDQARFTRDFRTLARITPTELLASRNPGESGSPLRSVFPRAERVFCDRGLIIRQPIPVEPGCIRGPAGPPVLDGSFVEVLVT
jgi:AraC-like DNA-binding protein